ncbi:MAG: CDP-alcohol phosphatidyltransferase family protein [Candidatus Kapabacteria bacterium]|nr:CDP-alcohol phosphatidyltransferase family protein [Candidatus Kapabacteria bacterium]MDW8012983.1 CDP-alcohol phosphatidyltransferase family protein [Bacteroidota bacterium]
MVLNIPNILTLTRLVLAPFVGVCLGVEQAWVVWLGAFLFAIAALTDGVDGWIARRYAQSTPEGAFLDPLADKVLALSVLLPLGWLGIAPAWMVAILVARDITTTLLRWHAIQQGELLRTLPAAQAKTFVQLGGLVVVVFLVALWRDGRQPHAEFAERMLTSDGVWGFFLVVTLLALWTLAVYAWRYRQLVAAAFSRFYR